MPRPRFHKLDEDKRQRIINAAAQAFAEHGYEGASLNQIIEQAGISKGAIYYYFDDKADLLVTVLADFWDRIMTMGEIDPGVLTADSFWPSIMQWLLHSLEAAATDPLAMGLGRLFYGLDPKMLVGTVIEEEYRKAMALLDALLTRGQDLGVVRDDMPKGLLVALVAGAGESTDRWMAEHWDELDPAETMTVSMRLLSVFQRMLEPAGEDES